MATPAQTTMEADDAVLAAATARLVQYFESLTPESVARAGEFYTADALFKDPFNEVRGVPAIEHIYRHMFVALAEPRFVVTATVRQGRDCFLTWNFRFRMRRFDTRTEQVIRGATHLTLDAQGRVSVHRDYWDAAEELYEKLPLLGGLMRWLKRRASQ